MLENTGFCLVDITAKTCTTLEHKPKCLSPRLFWNSVKRKLKAPFQCQQPWLGTLKAKINFVRIWLMHKHSVLHVLILCQSTCFLHSDKYNSSLSWKSYLGILNHSELQKRRTRLDLCLCGLTTTTDRILRDILLSLYHCHAFICLIRVLPNNTITIITTAIRSGASAHSVKIQALGWNLDVINNIFLFLWRMWSYCWSFCYSIKTLVFWPNIW